MTSIDWNDPARFLPTEGQVVWAILSGGTVQKLAYKNNLWWFPDMSMYVYYTPTFWKDL